MVATKEKRALFGGALRCAGLAAAAVTATAAGEFIPYAGGANYARVFAYDDAGGLLALEGDYNAGGAFTVPQSYAGPGGTLSAYAGSSLMGVSVTVGDPSVWGYARADLLQYFTVDNVKDVLLEWNFDDGTGYFQRAGVYEVGVGYLAAYAGGSGSLALSLTAGSTYVFITNVSTGISDSGTFFTRLSNIPTPGTLALLGVGLVAGRRRRRE